MEEETKKSNMNWILGAIVVLLLLGGGYMVFKQQNSTMTHEQENTMQTAQPSVTNAPSQAMKADTMKKRWR